MARATVSRGYDTDPYGAPAPRRKREAEVAKRLEVLVGFVLLHHSCVRIRVLLISRRRARNRNRCGGSDLVTRKALEGNH